MQQARGLNIQTARGKGTENMTSVMALTGYSSRVHYTNVDLSMILLVPGFSGLRTSNGIQHLLPHIVSKVTYITIRGKSEIKVIQVDYYQLI